VGGVWLFKVILIFLTLTKTFNHAQVVGREHGIPVIAGAKDATAKLKDGMKVRVDGDHGAVYIID